MRILISSFGQNILLLSSFDFQRAVKAGEVEPASILHSDNWSARSFFHQHFTGAYEIGTLRQVLASEIYDITRISDDEVLDAAALQLSGGRWCLGRQRNQRPQAVTTGAAKTSERVQAAVWQRSVEVPRSRHPPAQPRQLPVIVPEAVTAAEPEWTENTDQAAFANVLIRAAREATPFCEVCAALRAQKAAALA